jgi:hypothetical protein
VKHCISGNALGIMMHVRARVRTRYWGKCITRIHRKGRKQSTEDKHNSKRANWKTKGNKGTKRRNRKEWII